MRRFEYNKMYLVITVFSNKGQRKSCNFGCNNFSSNSLHYSSNVVTRAYKYFYNALADEKNCKDMFFCL